MNSTADQGREGKQNPDINGLLFSRFSLRHWLQDWKLTLILVLIVALGVAVFLSIRLANKAAVSGFGLFTESISGQSDYLIRPGVGDLPMKEVRKLRQLLGSLPVGLFPVLETSAVVTGDEERTVRLLGVDLIALQNAGNYTDGAESISFESDGGSGSESPPFLEDERMVFSGAAFAERYGLESGDDLQLTVGDQSAVVSLGGVLSENPNLPSIPPGLIIMDLPALHALIRRGEVVSRIEVRIPPGARSEEIANQAGERLEWFVKERTWILETPTQRKSSVTQMSAAFRLNLTILSGLALLVGTYLIVQAMEAAVIKRQSEIAIQRSLGVTPAQIRKGWVIEGLAMGVLGSLVGVLLGVMLATVMVGAIARTVNTLYYETTTDAISIEFREVLFSFLFGVLASLLAILVPARDAAMTPPAQLVRKGSHLRGLALLRQSWLGFVLVGMGAFAAFLPPLQLSGESPVPLGGYLAAVLIVVGSSILSGGLFRPFASLIERAVKKSRAIARYAASHLKHPGGRHRLTAAGLAVAIGMSAAMAILVASFENTLTSWIRQMLQADLYVSGAGAQSVSNENSISGPTWNRIESLPEVKGVDTLRRYRITFEGRETYLGGADYFDAGNPVLIWLREPKDATEAGMKGETGKAIPGWFSESFCRRFDVGVSDSVVIATPGGNQTIVVDGIFTEYGNESGMMLVHRDYTRAWFDDDTVSNVAVYGNSGADPEVIKTAIERINPTLRVRTNARLREESIRIFHQTFAVTYALEGIAVVIAVAGLGLALAGLLIDRRAELATLKSLGATRRQIALGSMVEGAGITAVGLVGGLLMSFVLGWILIYVINPQSFGWTLTYRVPWLGFVLLAAATMLAGGWVAYGVGYRYAVIRSDQED